MDDGTKGFDMRLAVLLLTIFIAWPSPSLACLGVMSESATFLRSFPKEAQARAVVAKVKIVETAMATNAMSRLSVVEVIEPVKGAAKGDRFKVISETHSCARDYEVKTGELYFIAGSFNPDGTFSGIWKMMELAE